MKDAKGHGSNKRGGGMVRVSVNPAKLGFRMADIGPGGVEHNVVTGGAPMPAAHQGRVATVPANRPKVGGPHKVQTLALDRAGQPWATAKGYGNKTVAEHVAKYMRTDGGYTRVRSVR